MLADAAAQGGETPPLVVFVLHALPNRGCDDDAPASPVCCVYRTDGGCDFAAAGDCEVGLAEYLDGYVEPLASLLAANARVPAVVVLEPAALPALAAAAPGCGAPSTRAAYLGGLGAAIDRLSTRAPHAALYLGAGDGPRLGYGALARRLAIDASRLGLGRTRSVRGFATNIGSYQPVGAACKLDDDGSLARRAASAPTKIAAPTGATSSPRTIRATMRSTTRSSSRTTRRSRCRASRRTL